MIRLMTKRTQEQLLVSKSQRGERDAFDELVTLYRDRLDARIRSKISARLRSQLEPEDLVQETLLRAFESIGTFQWQGEDGFCRWLFGIADHVILKAAKKNRRVLRLDLAHEAAGSGVSPSRAMQREERHARFESALKNLSPEHRQVILLTRFEGCSLKEAARRMNRTPAAIGQLLASGHQEADFVSALAEVVQAKDKGRKEDILKECEDVVLKNRESGICFCLCEDFACFAKVGRR